MSQVQVGPAASGRADPNLEPVRHVQRLLLGFLRELFGSAPEGEYRWNRDDEITEIGISSNYPIKKDVVNKRPQIISILGGFNWAGLSLDQFQGKSGMSKTRSDLIRGSLSINVLCMTPDEASHIAFTIGAFTVALRDVLQKTVFHEVSPPQISPPLPAGSYVEDDPTGEVKLVSVICGFSFGYEVIATPKYGATLGDLVLRLSTLYEPIVPDVPRVDLIGTAPSFSDGSKPGILRPDLGPVELREEESVTEVGEIEIPLIIRR